MRAVPVTMSLLLTLCTSTNAFAVLSQRFNNRESLAISMHLDEVDEMCVENVANLCVEPETNLSGCDLEEFEALVNTLQEQRSYHQDRVAALDELLLKLRGDNSSTHSPETMAKAMKNVHDYLRKNVSCSRVFKSCPVEPFPFQRPAYLMNVYIQSLTHLYLFVFCMVRTLNRNF